MGIIIEDGKGSGKKAQIDANNLLLTKAVTESTLSHKSHEFDSAFGISTPMLTVTTTGGRMLFIKNTSSSSKFFITDLWFNWNGGTASHNTCCFGELIFGDTVPDTNIIIGGAGNLNRTSVNTIDLTVLYWDDSAGDGMIGHTPGTTAFYWCYSKAPAYYHTDGSIILGTNDTLSVNLKGEETGEGSINILGYASE